MNVDDMSTNIPFAFSGKMSLNKELGDFNLYFVTNTNLYSVRSENDTMKITVV